MRRPLNGLPRKPLRVKPELSTKTEKYIPLAWISKKVRPLKRQ